MKMASEDIVRSAWRHAEVGRNDQPRKQSTPLVCNKEERNSLSGKTFLAPHRGDVML